MEIEVREMGIYTTEETLSLLKISKSTFLRLVKKGILSASKIGGQYRILGREILELFNPKVRLTAINTYSKVSAKVKRKLAELDKE
jgi:excisionase family DNA binding protein